MTFRPFVGFAVVLLMYNELIVHAQDPAKASIPPAGAQVFQHGAAVSVSPEASDVGLSVLKAGGNAVDSAVATALALAVTWPEAGNLGGGGFMMIWPGAGKPPVCIDYRETAPQAAKEAMFAQEFRPHSHLAVGVPGTVRGLALAHQQYGKLAWRELVKPAERLASQGFVVDASLARSLNGVLKTTPVETFPEFRRVFGPPEGRAEWKPGDRLVQPDLAQTLARLADGPEGFYAGRNVELLVAEMKAGGGLITADDLAGYQAKVREPIRGTYKGHEIFGPPPPSSGGIVLVEMLNILERFELKRPAGDGPAWTAETMHLVVESMRRAYRDRAEFLGDADFVKIPPTLVSKEHAGRLAEGIDRARATPSADLAGAIKLSGESDSTTHFSTIDGSGMAVSNTYTLEHSFGSRVVVRGAGYLLNNEMGDFNRRPGWTDRKGAIGTSPNLIAPGKRMLSSQTPAFVAKDGKLLLVTGSPGGRTIINTVLCVVLQAVEFGRPVDQAVGAPRFHQGWFPDLIRFEGNLDPAYAETIAALERMGHKVDREPYRQGDAHSIWVDPATGKFHAAADRRLGGKASGF